MKNVLIVEDDEDIRECLQMAIVSEDINVITASDGLEAWEKMSSAHIDLVITDYLMPKMNGAELSKMTRQKFPEIPIILISTFEPRDLGIGDIIHKFLSKPFEIGNLKEEVESVLGEGVL